MKQPTITQKPCIRKSMSFEGEHQKIEHDGSRNKFSAYISMSWPDEKLMYKFYDEMNSINTIDPLENLKLCTMKMVGGKTDTHMGQCFIPFKQNGHGLCHTQKEDWLTIIHLPKKAPYLNPNERKVNQQKSQMYVRIDSMNI
jgi:hypothetical protein